MFRAGQRCRLGCKAGSVWSKLLRVKKNLISAGRFGRAAVDALPAEHRRSAKKAIVRKRQPNEPVLSGLFADGGLALGRSCSPALPRIEVQGDFDCKAASLFRAPSEPTRRRTTGDGEDIFHGKVIALVDADEAVRDSTQAEAHAAGR
jgi:hypothetical protein